MWVVFSVATFATASEEVIYVDANAAGANKGTNWVDAYSHLQDALIDANSSEKPVEIRVAQGTYKPDLGKDQTPGDRTATFQILNSVTISGGYAGLGESEPNARDVEVYETILSGDLSGDDTYGLYDPSRSENSYHVVTGSGTDATAVLDGFTVTGGNADASWDPNEQGGGMYNYSGRATVVNCIFRSNVAGQGGGMYNENSSPTVTDCTFSGNLAFLDDAEENPGGGGMYNYKSSPTITNSTFSGNSVDASYHIGGDGGGVFCGESSPTLVNCTFIGNSARRYGGGMTCWWGGSPTLTNCTFSGNSAAKEGGAMDDYKTEVTVTNCRFTGNSAKRGAGLLNYFDSNLTLTNCTFRANSADDHGGAMFNVGCNLTLANCIFKGNRAGNYGAGMHNNRSTLTLTNCTLAGNSSPNGRSLAFDSHEQKYPSNLRAANCILWDGGGEVWNHDASTITMTFSDVQSGWPGEENIDVDPCFAELGSWDPNGTLDDVNDDFWVDGDYHLKSQAGRWDASLQTWIQDDLTSPCIDAGDPSSAVGFEPFSNGGIVNMGAYGGTAEASKSYFGEPVCETIVAGDINGDCRVDFLDLALMAAHWLEER